MLQVPNADISGTASCIRTCTARSPDGDSCFEAATTRSGQHCARHHNECHEHCLQYKDASTVVKYLKERHRDLFAWNIEPFQDSADLDCAIEYVREYLRVIDDEVRLREEHQSRFYHETIDQGHEDWISHLSKEKRSINMLYKTLATRQEQAKQEEISRTQEKEMSRKQWEGRRLLGVEALLRCS
ncbi:hypothetical protein A0H81_12114 [Grifola frondosa]|uniref:Uncharacterized protein n=1 Tax=Grifola frondosa TaxID=5627 RepID=A0A1C7LUA5_GRIFR|nr:hypothetical protein A0H81_12114 [Grifola frondosa]